MPWYSIWHTIYTEILFPELQQQDAPGDIPKDGYVPESAPQFAQEQELKKRRSPHRLLVECDGTPYGFYESIIVCKYFF
jgi:hypothetical protein